VRNFPGYRPISSLFLSILSNTTIGYRLARARYPCFMFTYCGTSKQVPVGLSENRETLKGAGIAGQYRFYRRIGLRTFYLLKGGYLPQNRIKKGGGRTGILRQAGKPTALQYQ